MKLNNKGIFALKGFVFVAIAAGIAMAGFNIKETKATLTGPNGTCGFSLTSNVAGMNLRIANFSTVPISTMGVINFNTLTINFTGVDVTNYGKSNAQSVVSSGGERAFTMATGSFPGNYVLSLNDEYNSKLSLISTNSGNTYLVQTLPTANDNGPIQAGVCQAL